MRKLERGLTLLELTVSILIVALLIAILIPVVLSIRTYSQRGVCASNLRQLYLGWSLYLQDYSGSPRDGRSWAPKITALMPYLKDKRVLTCPLDPQGGIFSQHGDTPLSYYYPGLENHPLSMTAALLKTDSNPGVFACMLHGKCRFYPPTMDGQRTVPDCYGTVLRCCIDGSVKTARLSMMCQYDAQARLTMRGTLYWYLLSDLPCPPELCAATWVPCRQEDLPF